jgi:Fe-S cluster assembly scaffold protein SufB
MNLTDWGSFLGVVIGSLAAFLTALAAIRNAIIKSKEQEKLSSTEFAKLDIEEKLSLVDITERLQKMFLEHSEKQSTKIERLERKIKETDDCIHKYSQENAELRLFIRKIFIRIEEGVHEIRIDESTDKSCMQFLDILEDLLQELKEYYKAYLQNGKEDTLTRGEKDDNL